MKSVYCASIILTPPSGIAKHCFHLDIKENSKNKPEIVHCHLCIGVLNS